MLYDGANRRSWVKKDGVLQSSYTYTQDELTSRTHPAGTTDFTYDPSMPRTGKGGTAELPRYRRQRQH